MHPDPSAPRGAKRRALRSLLLLIAILGLGYAGLALAQSRVVTTAVSIRQDLLTSGFYTNKQVIEAGRQFFAGSYLPADGHGEGDDGPRSQQRIDFWPTIAGVPEPYIPFLRLNGLDSQTCFACHNTIGTFQPDGARGLDRKPGGVGGSADFASVLFGNDDFPKVLTHIVRVAPRAMGSAYLQTLAIEMTGELLKIEKETTAEAAQMPGFPKTGTLIAKGVKFGEITITCPNSTCGHPIRDTSKVVGVSPDLIVRPLQHKGVAATLRSFVKTALDFHHSMQAVEVVGVDRDCDRDGRINEMGVDDTTPAGGTAALSVQQSLGNVAALAAFTGMLRPPFQAATGSAEGETLFEQVGCSECHLPRLTTGSDPQFMIKIAQPASECPNHGIYGVSQLGSFAEADAAEHPAKQAAEGLEALKGTSLVCPSGFFCIDLTNPGPVPAEIQPRLPANHDGSVTVPLYSDLKRHKMGVFLSQSDPPQADDAGNDIDNLEWLTTKLWGVADNGPWIHDGRARTLRDAIVFHAGPDGNDPLSEAHDAVQSFLGLPKPQQQAVIDFLESLQIPPVP